MVGLGAKVPKVGMKFGKSGDDQLRSKSCPTAPGLRALLGLLAAPLNATRTDESVRLQDTFAQNFVGSFGMKFDFWRKSRPPSSVQRRRVKLTDFVSRSDLREGPGQATFAYQH